MRANFLPRSKRANDCTKMKKAISTTNNSEQK